MTKRKLRGFVLPTLYTLTILVIMIGVGFLVSGLNKNYSNYVFGTKVMKDNSIPVITTEGQAGIIRPYTDSSVSISKSYYDIKADESSQQNSLIYYQRTYMENTGVLYTSDNEFDVVAVLDGTIKNVKTDELLGNVVEIEHSNDLVTVYYSLNSVEVKAGDKILKGQTLAKSGSNKLENEKDNCLLFEVYYKGNLLDPEVFYNMNIEEL